MKVEELMGRARDTLSVGRVYGEPYEGDGVTVIPAAAVRGCVCGGQDSDVARDSGGGMGMMARPVGAYEIRDGEVTWVPAADTTKVLVLAEVLGIVALLVLRSILRSRRAQTN